MSTAYEQLFACDCAERVVHLCDDVCDVCRRRALARVIAVARRFAFGAADEEELSAATDAAYMFLLAGAPNTGPETYVKAAVLAAAYGVASAAADAAAAALPQADRERERAWQDARREWYAQGHRPDGPEYSVAGWEEVQDG